MVWRPCTAIRFTGPLSYSSQGGIESTDFLVLAAIVFGLSTD
jgi:hypothetical protein